jgi:drug/metabolite transporter (DMT)-like permease
MLRSGSTTSRARVLLGLLVVIWAVSWPVIKIGVAAVPPIWYGCLRYLIATSCLFTLVAVRGELVVPSRRDLRLVVVSGVFQMGAYSALTGLALTILPPGRASVLAYSTPLWVVPLAAWWLHEPVSRRALSGVGFGLLGVLVIASPALLQHGGGQLASYAMLMGAAAAWAISIIFVRAHRFDSSALALAPWQALVATALLAPLAGVVEGRPHALDWRGAASLAYVGPVATAFAYWAIVEVGRQLRASTISMALLATPTLGLLISALTLGERVSGSLATGVLFVGAGIRLATSSQPIRSRAIERSA